MSALLLAALALFCADARAAEEPTDAVLIRPPETRSRIQGLTWISKGLSYLREPGEKPGEAPLKIRLQGRFERKNWLLSAPRQRIELMSTGQFDIVVPVRSEITKVTFVAVSPLGEIQTEVVLVRSHEGAWRKNAPEKERKPGARRLTLSAGLGWTYLAYREDPGNIRLSEVALTPKFVAAYPLLPGKIDLGANIFFNVVSLTHSPSTINSVRFLGVNGRFGFTLPARWAGATWKLLTGWYLWTMRTEGRAYGVDLLSGPQLFLSAAKFPKEGRGWFGYLKYAPIGDIREGISLSHRELAIGGGVQLLSKPNRWGWAITLDLTDARYESELQGNSLVLNTATLGVQASLL
ncbi:MAG: hypothetical protein IT285_03065 [Bdellovibrionales bacterium]|nr:hypothetical protein [Bdellovibrionales bacterium]